MIEYIYPTPILCEQATQGQLLGIQGEITRALKHLSFAENKQWGPGHLQVTDTSGVSNVIKDYNLINLSKYISGCVKQYARGLDHDICQSWITKTSKGQVAAAHNHGQFDIAGVYYYKTNEKDGALKFSNPNTGAHASKSWMMSQDVRIQPKVGSLILFPGWLDHSVDLNTTNDDRMSLAFNINIDRSMYNSSNQGNK